MLLFLGRAAWGQAPPVVQVQGSEGDCPSAAGVVAALSQLLPQRVVTETAPSDSRAERVQIDDRGPQYRISVAGSKRQLQDPARACDERARIAAVFIHSVLDPPSVAALERPPAPPRLRPQVRLDVGGIFDIAPRGAPNGTLLAGGGFVRAFVGGEHVGATLGVTALSPVNFDFADVRVRVTRIPFDLSLRGMLLRGRVELAGDLGLVATLTLSESFGLSVQQRVSSPELGIRAAGQIAVWLGKRVAPFVGLETIISPRPGNFVLEQFGKLGSLPYVWVGVTAGLTVKIK
jgi:hypothetical protein